MSDQTDNFTWPAPDQGVIDPKTDPTAYHNLMTHLHIAGAKVALLKGDHASAHQHLNAASQQCCLASETDLHSRAGE